jgi:hypothetical protein
VGTLHFYRPSDQRLDFTVEMKLDSCNRQKIRTTPMARGLWKVEAGWKAKGGEYFATQPIVVN